ncbi:hypothetical protein PSMK_16860 [Phycisphaera mikurensis NBRC 102666]|uniref:Uncharacterized protein n=1 Tax=Phycisphaera mikurensis (strain NBRC 102666 / KCTC 22515 / FYK2301M01) TaxID=1142394 RepID=I0IF07_PHYMF|nr:hypothetical protein PSMK_16860 [Phycisphaera mikurensis NBRC 102666]
MHTRWPLRHHHRLRVGRPRLGETLSRLAATRPTHPVPFTRSEPRPRPQEEPFRAD